MQLILLCISIGAALLLASSSSQSESYDRSVFDLLIAFGVSAVSIYLVTRKYPSFFDARRDRKGRFDSIPLQEFDSIAPTEQDEQRSLDISGPSIHSQIAFIQIAILVLTIRIELYRRISDTSQCASRSPEVWLPLVLAINEYRLQRSPQVQTDEGTKSKSYSAPGYSVLSKISSSPWRYIPSALVLSYGCYLITALSLARSSTFICPMVSGDILSIPRLQQYAILLDCVLATIMQEIARSKNSSRHRLLSAPLSYATILSGAVVCWITYAIMLYITRREQMQWIFINDTPSLLKPIWLTLSWSLIVAVFVVSGISHIIQDGVYLFSTILIASVTTYLGFRNLWLVQETYPPQTSTTSAWSFIFIYIGACSSYHISQVVNQSQTTRSLLWQSLLFLGLVLFTIPQFWKPNHLKFHPIDLLMSEAEAQHQSYVDYASKSTDLRSAARIYRERYGVFPPTGFDKWYEYARNRSVVIIDDYDQIERDLLPFWAISPDDIRRRTWEAVSNPWNEISGISIRNGKAEIQENVIGTHRWMLEGVAVLINSFAEHLPDMDLAFNLNDESRVAVPNEEISRLRNAANKNSLKSEPIWSKNRATTWLPVSMEAYGKTVFENWSFQRNFRRFGSIGCPSNSLSKTHPNLNSQSSLCLQCLKPHSLGQFVSNWTLAADMCHQPDMSHLHGFYLSPAAFKTTHQLMPVFSQSKASGYNDILYPSAWNYRDKVVYAPANASGEPGQEGYKPAYLDPPFAEKENTIYWRGATSEGVSAGLRPWLGMNRQRLVHLLSNSTSNSDHDHITILLPDPNNPANYVYHALPGRAAVDLGLQQKTNVKIVDNIVRCGGIDCTDQEKEFGLVPPVDFQSHWRYRFLFDMDGAAFSGRFLPFLQSGSLPFKTALFREWYDSRLTAWRHFVPVDMRLHGVWSTLAYFAGVDGVWPGTTRKYKWDAHVKEGEKIAEEGRKWANTVLRKEDMEVYFFRLLLEWGRLTDDRREQIMFDVE